ncbi:ABC lipoprotein exporter, inner membrane subunit [gamma proteobacterium HdN1]|nr:ABC lipoprotein exporter, inner membrane subunit [gamma proteobacterium HdN1]
MFRPLPLYIGLRYTRAKRRNHFISFISLTSILGLTLGVAVLIVVLAVMSGFDRELQSRILGMVSQAEVTEEGGLKDWQRVVDVAQKTRGVVGAAPYVQLQGLLSHQGLVSGALVSGISPDLEGRVSVLPEHMVSGQIESLQAGQFNIVLGYGVARKLGLALGDRVALVLPEASIGPAGVLPRFKRFTVTGVFRVGAEVDDLIAYIALEDARKLARSGERVHGVRLKVDDLLKARVIAERVAAQLQASTEAGLYQTGDWTRTYGNLFQAVKLERTMMGLLLMLIVAVAAFNIVSSLIMMVTDKKADIAILRTLGASPRTIMGVFIVQGSFIGFVGTAAGAILGIVIALNITESIRWLESSLNLSLFRQYFVNYLPSELRWEHVITVIASALVMSFFATLYPALRASKIQPAEALRHE